MIAVQFKDLSWYVLSGYFHKQAYISSPISSAGEVTVTHSSNEMAMAVNSFTRSIKFVQTATYKTYSGSLSADKLSCGGKEIVANLRVNTKDECHQVDGRSTHCFLSVPGTEGDSH